MRMILIIDSEPAGDHNYPMTTIADLKKGEQAIVTKINDSFSDFRQRLLSMGITPAAHLTLVRKAPLGDPVQISIRGSELCLRLSEARLIEVQKVPS